MQPGFQVVTRSLTSSTSRSTAWTPCLAALAPCCSTVDATRLIRVTGDCFRADRVLFRFVAAGRLDFLAADFEPAPRRALVLAVVLPRELARFVTLVVFRRDFARDDFDRVAMSVPRREGTTRPFARFAHAVVRAIFDGLSHARSRNRRITWSLRFASGRRCLRRRRVHFTSGAKRHIHHPRRTQNHSIVGADAIDCTPSPARRLVVGQPLQARDSNTWRNSTFGAAGTGASTRHFFGRHPVFLTAIQRKDRTDRTRVEFADSVAPGDGGTDRSSTARVEHMDQFGW